jgi:predicted dehydrogenase
MPALARDTFNVALIGYGLAGACFHAPFIATTDGLRLTTIVTRDPDRRSQASERHPSARLVGDVDDIWRDAGNLHLVVIASPNRTHVPYAEAALDAGLSVVVDKPVASTAAKARSLVARTQPGSFLTVFQNRRWDGDFITLRRVLSEERLGRPLRFESRFERWRPELLPTWRQSPDTDDAGGLLYDLGSHLIDQAMLLFGPVSHVYAELDLRRPGAEVDDDSFVALTHANGVRSHLFMSVVAAQRGPRFRVLGSRAAFVKYGMDVQEDRLKEGQWPDRPDWGEEPAEDWGQIGAADRFERVPTARGAYQDFYAGVVKALRGEAPPPVDPADAAAVLDVIERARRQAQRLSTSS